MSIRNVRIIFKKIDIRKENNNTFRENKSRKLNK